MSAPAWSVRGHPTDAELAAVVAVLAAAAGFAPPVRRTDEDAQGWSAYWRGLRGPVAPGPGAWRASGLPAP